MTLIGWVCLLLAVVATLLLVLYLMQRKELAGVVDVSRQLQQMLGSEGTPSGRVYLQTEEPALQELAQDVNQLLARAAQASAEQQVAPQEEDHPERKPSYDQGVAQITRSQPENISKQDVVQMQVALHFRKNHEAKRK